MTLLTPSTHQNKKLILCADDYGQTAAISDGIIQLAALKRINAMSCMVTSPFWDTTYSKLHPFVNTHYIGLHLNLTFGSPLSAIWKQGYGEKFPGLVRLINRAYLRQLDVFIVADEIQRQLDRFVRTMNRFPDFIDGHEHCHQLPIVRDALLLVIKRLEMAILIRNTVYRLGALIAMRGFPKSHAIALLGGLALKKRLIQEHRIANTCFSGVYPFHRSSRYADYFKRFLQDNGDGGLIMCHPGARSDDRSDPIAASRVDELTYFLSEDFLQDLALNQFELGFKEVRC